MKAFLQRALGLLVAGRHWFTTVRKAVVPAVTALVGFLALPELDVDPDTVKVVVAIAAVLGVWAAPNVASEPKDHKAL